MESALLPHEILADSGCVQAWSAFRLPFEPKAAAVLRFRDSLRAAILGLDRRPGLRAVYQSADPTPCDVENVALYNVGSAPFRGLGAEVLIVERPRGFSPRAPSGAALAHYVSYESLPTPTDWRAWQPHRKLIEWRAAPVEGPFTATNVWAALKRGAVRPWRAWNVERRLGVVVRLPGDRSLVGAVKALIDGVISAAHYIEGDDVVELGSLVSGGLRTRPQTATAWLTDRTAGVLGPRRLVLPRAGTFMWNPADDQVAAIRVERGPALEAEIWTLAPVIAD